MASGVLEVYVNKQIDTSVLGFDTSNISPILGADQPVLHCWRRLRHETKPADTGLVFVIKIYVAS